MEYKLTHWFFNGQNKHYNKYKYGNEEAGKKIKVLIEFL